MTEKHTEHSTSQYSGIGVACSILKNGGKFAVFDDANVQQTIASQSPVTEEIHLL